MIGYLLKRHVIKNPGVYLSLFQTVNACILLKFKIVFVLNTYQYYTSSLFVRVNVLLIVQSNIG